MFATARGERPVSTLLEALDDATLDKVFRVVEMLERYGPRTPAPYAKRVSKTVSELRTSGKNAIRILYCKRGGGYVLLHAFKKKSNKLPAKEVKIAEARVGLLAKG